MRRPYDDKTIILSFIILTIFISGFQANFATTYHVSTAGNNANPGTSASPFKTITYGVSKLAAGDILYVRSGEYDEVVTISKNGTANNPITVSGYLNNGSHEVPVINGGGSLPSSSWNALMDITGNYIHVAYFEISNSATKGYGLAFNGPGRNNKASFMKIHHIGQTGIMAMADYCTVEDCEVYLCCMSNSAHLAGSGWGNGIGFAREKSNGISEYGTIRRCRVYDNHGEGIDAFESSHITIEDCEIFNNWTQNLYVSDASYILVQRNMIYNTSNPLIPPRNGSRTGISLFEERAGLPCYTNSNFITPYSTDNTIINNFLCNADIGVLTWNEDQVINPGFKNGTIAYNTLVNGKLSIGNLQHENSQIRNNIFFGAGHSVPTSAGISFSNNCWKTAPPANAAGPGDVMGDPLLAKTGPVTPGELTADHFKLLPGSPAINKAMVLKDVKEDFFKTARGETPDIGGHQYSDPLVLPPENPGAFKLFPNPVRNNLTLDFSASQDNEQIQVFNSTGELIQELSAKSPALQVNVAGLPSGVYFVRLKKYTNSSIKFVKLR
jgi:hypothetical protein